MNLKLICHCLMSSRICLISHIFIRRNALALDKGRVVGTIGLMMKANQCAVLKKFFVKKEYRSQGIGLQLYQTLLAYVKEKGVQHIILDTPFTAKKSHGFYERAGFYKIEQNQLPVEYVFPDRNSLIYMLDCEE